MDEKEIYPLDEVHLDELLQHVDDSKGDKLHLATGRHPAILLLRLMSKSKKSTLTKS